MLKRNFSRIMWELVLDIKDYTCITSHQATIASNLKATFTIHFFIIINISIYRLQFVQLAQPWHQSDST